MAISTNQKNGHRRIQFTGQDDRRHTIRLGKVSKKIAEAIQSKVKALATARFANVSVDKEVADWLGGLDSKLYGKLHAVGLVPQRESKPASKLADFIDGYIKMRTDVKKATSTTYGHTRRNLVECFGKAKLLVEITAGDCDDWRIWLSQHEKLGENTIKKRCGIAKQFFRAAQRRKLIPENPFADMKGTVARGNRDRDFFVTQEIAQAVLDACPDLEWRLLFALSRFGGLRCPSEHLSLRWSDVNWAQDQITVHSPKTAHHDGRGARVIPIFKELRPHLEAARDQAEPGAEWVITRYRDASQNLRTQLERIIKQAGLEPWPKLFQNLRATRETELTAYVPLHAICAWIGHSAKIANQHYLQVTAEHIAWATQNATQQATAPASMVPQTAIADAFKTPVLLGNALSCEALQYGVLGPVGLEPTTKGL